MVLHRLSASPDHLRVSHVRGTDLPRVLRLLDQVPSDDISPGLLAGVIMLAEGSSSIIAMGAWLDGIFSGIALATICAQHAAPNHGHALLQDLVVALSQRRIGIGRELLLQIENCLATLGHTVLLASVKTPNVAMASMLRNQGYDEIDCLRMCVGFRKQIFPPTHSAAGRDGFQPPRGSCLPLP